ncbi:unnamed protein product [Meganyctiphanes norvegica]|uniref:Uncharacterized protein n=1 Tax=Meganyctiphanes norvegica TaxID=48144 RepID=A0AAV2PZ07_MEGNR
MKLVIASSCFTLLLVLCDAAIYEINQEGFADFIDSSHFELLSYDEITEIGYDRYVPTPPAGQHSSAFYLKDAVAPQYTNSHTLASSGAVTFEATYFCDNTISEFEVRFSYPWQDHFLVLCGPSSGSTPGIWQTKTKNFYCLSAQGCSTIEIWFYGITVSPGAIVGLQHLKIATDGSPLPTTTTSPNTATTTLEPTHLPTTNPVQTTEPTEQGLKCYSCADCPQVDQDTNMLQREEYHTCVLTFYGNIIIRGGSTEEKYNGDCIMHDGIMDCYCHSHLCNSQNITISRNTHY